MQQEVVDQERQLIAVIHKGEKQQIQVSLATYRGRKFGDLRLFVLKDGDWIPTQKGCTVGVEQLEELEEAVLKLRNAAEQSTHPF
jgi:Transcriptional Coactivator p15 (PC4)